jgi:hypothetical protein
MEKVNMNAYYIKVLEKKPCDIFKGTIPLLSWRDEKANRNSVRVAGNSMSVRRGFLLGYGLEKKAITVRFPTRVRDLFLLHGVHIGSGTLPVSNPLGTGKCYPRSKATGL